MTRIHRWFCLSLRAKRANEVRFVAAPDLDRDSPPAVGSQRTVLTSVDFCEDGNTKY